MAKENLKIDQVQYQELIESFKKLEDDNFPVKIEHSWGKDIIDTVRVTGHNRERVHLFKELARDAVKLFDIPCAGYEVEMWIRLVFEYVPKLAKRSPIGGGLIFCDDIHNAAEASVVAMRRLYQIVQKSTRERVEGKQEKKTRRRRTKDVIHLDEIKIFAHVSKNPECTRDKVAKATGIAAGTVSYSKAWKKFSKQRAEIRKANKAKNVKDIESFPS